MLLIAFSAHLRPISSEKRPSEIVLAKFLERTIPLYTFRNLISSWKKLSAKSLRETNHLPREVIVVQGDYGLVPFASTLKADNKQARTLGWQSIFLEIILSLVFL